MSRIPVCLCSRSRYRSHGRDFPPPNCAPEWLVTFWANERHTSGEVTLIVLNHLPPVTVRVIRNSASVSRYTGTLARPRSKSLEYPGIPGHRKSEAGHSPCAPPTSRTVASVPVYRGTHSLEVTGARVSRYTGILEGARCKRPVGVPVYRDTRGEGPITAGQAKNNSRLAPRYSFKPSGVVVVRIGGADST